MSHVVNRYGERLGTLAGPAVNGEVAFTIERADAAYGIADDHGRPILVFGMSKHVRVGDMLRVKLHGMLS